MHADVLKQLPPQIAGHCRLDRSWLWYCGPSLKDFPKLRAHMIKVGFRFKAEGHKFAGEERVNESAKWYHPLGQPVFRARRQSTKPRELDAVAQLAEVFG